MELLSRIASYANRAASNLPKKKEVPRRAVKAPESGNKNDNKYIPGLGHGLPEDKVEQYAESTQQVERIEKYVQNVQRDLQFSTNEETGKSIVKVYDTESKELIRQIPTEEVVQASRIIEKTTGIFIKTKV